MGITSFILKWFYSQKRTKLAVDQVEDMCKLHIYYITNAKRELPYYAVDTSECSLYKKMINTLIENIDIDLHIFNMKQNEFKKDRVIVSQRKQTVILDPEHKIIILKY
ncbi:hypothetical protein RhiirC2_792353 [Rhizophagus irregularis]|uniref:Uncharacterized protein n=1 Tax=Rhizophagus irregularis TaxID=588596 RepID=A0A2N1MHE2_9GLOM|nr:hypothetical protein RhiirC2_792353 [Rhizophagus irregularis]